MRSIAVKLLSALVIILLVGGFILYTLWQNNKDKAERWQGNYYETSERLKDSTSRIKTLRVSARELQSKRAEQDSVLSYFRSKLEDKDIKISQLQSALNTALLAKGSGKTEITDTVFVTDSSKLDTLKRFNVDDGYLDFEGSFDPIKVDSIEYNYSYEDEIFIATYLERKMYNSNGNKRFILWRWLFPQWQATGITADSKNPDSDIDITKLEIKGKK